MIKKLIFILFALMVTVGAKAVSDNIADPNDEGADIRWTLENGVLTLTGKGKMRNYGSIGDTPWEKNSAITKVVIGEGITSIGKCTFCKLEKLESVEIPSTVKTIGESAFEYSGLKSVEIPSNVETVEQFAFRFCTSIETATISCDSIGKSTFYGCTSLTSLTINNTNIGITVFDDCKLLQTITMNGVKTIGGSSFRNCSSLAQITLPSTLKSIGLGTFSGCSNLKSVVIPSSVTSIGKYAFEDCSELKVVYCMPNSAPTIDNSFPSDASIYVPKGATGYTSENNWPTVSETGFWTFDKTSNTISDGTTSLAVHCTNYDLTIGRNENQVFGDLDLNLPVIGTDNNIYNIPAIGENAFYKSTFTSLVLPDELTTIGSSAFEEANLTSVAIPPLVISIGSTAFYFCSNLASVTLSEGIKTIGQSAFKGCSALTSINIPSTVQEAGAGAFFTNNNLTTLTFKSVPHFLDTESGIYNFALYNVNFNLTDDSYVYTNQTFNYSDGATYTRTMKNQWGTIVLPFTATNGNDYDLYTVTSIDGESIELEKVGDSGLAAGTPALIRRSGNTAKNVTISGTSGDTYVVINAQVNNPKAVSGLTLTGAFTKTDITDQDGYIIANNAFWNIADIKGEYKVYCSPFRAYLAGTLPDDAKQLTIGGIDDAMTAIETIDTPLGNLDDASIYDLNGRRIADLQKGINIVKYDNGVTKKIIVK